MPMNKIINNHKKHAYTTPKQGYEAIRVKETTTRIYISLPNTSTLMLIQSTPPWSITYISPNLKQPWNSLSLSHIMQGRSSPSFLNSFLDIFFPLVLFSVRKKSPIYCKHSQILM